MAFQFEALEIPGIVLVRPARYRDARGFFSETYRRSAFREGGVDAELVQDNVARSTRGVLRGLHFQAPPAVQGKLVGVVRGSIYDVAVDLRPGDTYGRWLARTLDDEAGEMLWIPPGFAHGYLALSEVADVAYLVSAEYDPSLDGGLRWDDPTLAIEWPIESPVLSERDRSLPSFEGFQTPFTG